MVAALSWAARLKNGLARTREVLNTPVSELFVRRRVESLLKSWEHGVSPTVQSYRVLQLASIRVQAALWHPSGWWFALW